jgi:hypothetical protein
MMRSETFADLIKNNPDANELILDGTPVEIFEVIYLFIYTDEAPKDPKNAQEIFAAASKLKIKKLKEIYAKILIEKVENEKNLEELWKIFNLGVKFEFEELKLKAFGEIKGNFGENLKDDFLNDPEKLKKIIEAKLTLEEQLRDRDEEIMINEKSLKTLLDEMETKKDLKFLLENFNLGVEAMNIRLKLKAFNEIKKHFDERKLNEELLEDPQKLNKIVKAKIDLDELFG